MNTAPAPPRLTVARLVGDASIGVLPAQAARQGKPGQDGQPSVQRVRWEPVAHSVSPPAVGTSPEPDLPGADPAPAYVPTAHPPAADPWSSPLEQQADPSTGPVAGPVVPAAQIAGSLGAVAAASSSLRAATPGTDGQSAAEPGGPIFAAEALPPLVQRAVEQPAAYQADAHFGDAGGSDGGTPGWAPPVTPSAPSGGAPDAALAGAGPAGGVPAEPDELLKRLFDPLLRRLKTELRLDRERYGALTDRA